MIERVYQKKCNTQSLVSGIVAAGLSQDPTPGYRFFGVGCDPDPSSPVTRVYVCDDMTAGELAILDGVIAVHVYTAPKDLTPFLSLTSADGSLWCLSVDNAGVLTTTKVS